jgi:Bacterial PH domain
MTHFRASWSKSLIAASTFATLVCLGMSYFFWTMPGNASLEPLRFWLGVSPLAIVALCALFTVRGYSLTADALLIDRPFWKTRVPLRELQSVKFDPDLTRRSVRTFGNGGFFSFTGYFRNKELGSYRAFMTDRRRAVALRFPNYVIVVSPDRPEHFVSVISQYAGRG